MRVKNDARLEPLPRAGMGHLWAAARYGLMIAAVIGLFLVIRSRGEGLTAPAPVAGTPPGEKAADSAATLFHVLLALAAIMVTGRTLGKLLTYLGQPPVIGEVLAGISLGPSLLGWVAPAVSAYLLPLSVAP